MFVVNIKDDTPVYVQLQNQVLDYIALGILQKDDQLPSVRSLSKELGINPNTVAKAYANLEMQGYVYTLAGKGVFVKAEDVSDLVFDKKLDEFHQKVNDCKNVGISKEKLIEMVENIYKEVESHVED